MRWQKLISLVSILILIQIASAQTIQVEMNPKVLLPGDVAECKLTINVQKRTYVEGITFFAPHEIEVMPGSVSSIGWLEEGSSYELPFLLKAKESGIYTVRVYVNTINGTLKGVVYVRVESRLPEIVLDKTVLTLNEVNDVGFTISSNLDISNVVVEPLFDANPKTIYVKDNRGSFKFEPKDERPLKFRIRFYNGRNYHEVIQTVGVVYKESKGVVVNSTFRYSVVLIGDVIKLDIGISNLRNDNIYSVKINISDGIISRNELTIPVIKSGESRYISLEWCSRSPGIKRVYVSVEYMDELNYKYRIHDEVGIRVLNETTIQLSNVDIERRAEGLTVTGDISNNGRSRAYNILITASAGGISKTYYIDYLDPSDFDSFEITIPTNLTYVILKITWNNEIGEVFEEERVLQMFKGVEVEEEGTKNIPLIISVSVLAFVVLMVVIAWKKKS